MPIYLPPLSRRRFLAGSLAAGAGLLLPRLARSEWICTDPNRWVLLSDTHIWENREEPHNGVKPAENLAAAVRQIVALRPRPTGVIVSGDCVYLQGEPGDYAVLAEEVRPLRQAGLAVYLALGNHDHREHFWTAFPDARPARTPAVAAKHVWIVPTPWANWFLLDSLHKTNYTPGRLGEEQLRWLAAALNARPYRPALIVAHHHPAKGEKDSGLIDTRAFFDVIAPRKQVKAYFYGHTHEWRVGQRDDVRLVNVPALAWLFDEKQPRGWLDVRLRADGAALVLNTLDPKDSRHGQPTELEWRPGDVAPPPPAATTPRRRRRFRRGYSVLRK